MNKKIILGLISLTLFALASCKIEPIFYAIEKEVPLEEAVIKGNLYAMTEFQGKLYAASGMLYVKNASDKRGWEKASTPSGNIIRVASDSTNLYVLTSDKKLYTSTDGKNWDLINLPDIVELFDNKATETDEKVAYVTTKESIFILSGSSEPSTELTDETASENSIAAVFYGTETIFSNKNLIAAGEHGVYTIDDNTIVFDGTKTNVEVKNALSMAVYHDGANEYLVIGTENGIEVIRLVEGAPTTKGAWLGDNADSSFALVEIPTLYSFEKSIYAGAVDRMTSKKTKVWGYYTDRAEWNVE